MLIYHPAYDAYHCVFRMLLIIEKIPQIELDKARILDFYLAFPSALARVRWPASQRGAKRIAITLSNPYREVISPRVTLHEMRHMQEAALRCLAASELIEINSLEVGDVARTQLPLTSTLLEAVEGFRSRNDALVDLVFGRLAPIALLGAGGLKDRTSLMDFRYDTA